MQPATFSIAVNDYGFELATATDIGWREALRPARRLLAEDDLLPDVLASLNAGELAARRLREIARVGGRVFQGHPGQPKATRELQTSASPIHEVLRRHDAGNLLLGQAEREVLEQELDLARLRAAPAADALAKPGRAGAVAAVAAVVAAVRRESARPAR